jgi:transcriptional regulator with XRE-family HTH domain
MPMDELREARALTQTQLAEILHVSQGAVSKVERRADMYISTLRSYVRAMGGDLQMRAVFPDGEVIINQFQDLDADAEVIP